MNRVCIIGRLGQTPELKYAKDGETAICNFSIAFDQYRGDRGWVDVTCFKKAAEALVQYCEKGDEVAVDGVLSYREWDAGSGGKGRRLEIAADRVDFLRKKSQATGQQKASGDEPAAAAPVRSEVAAPVQRQSPAALMGMGDEDDPFGDS